MTGHRRFKYNSINELAEDIRQLGVRLPVSDNTKVLGEPVELGARPAPNRLAVQPMEGCDGTPDGRPGELTLRRYERFAAGGAGLLWFEATAVMAEARANPRQLHLSGETMGDFERMLKRSLETAARRFGSDFRPYTVLQLTHSGRYSRPIDKPQPIIAARNPYLDQNASETNPPITDEELEALEDRYLEAARIAGAIGFDAVDIKSCHRYLISELLSAHLREGIYGGPFENRTRFLLNIIDKIKGLGTDGPDVTVRLNMYDAIPFPYGWGVARDDHRAVDLSEPLRLVEILAGKGLKLINITAGNPYYNPHVNRPYDTGPYVPVEHGLIGVERLLGIARRVQETAPDTAVIASGLTWLRDYAPLVAAGGIEKGWFRISGFGRQAFAYPDFAADTLFGPGMDRRKCCIACGKCSELMRLDSHTGCVIRDKDVYAPMYKAASEGKASLVGKHVAEHV